MPTATDSILHRTPPLTLRDIPAPLDRARWNGNNIEWHDRTGAVALQVLVGGHIFGLTLSNNAGDATNDIDIAVGAAVDSTEATTMRLTTALIKQLDVAWAVGTNAGGRMSAAGIANTTYHMFLIQRVDTGVTDIGFDTSATAPTLPTSYTLFRRIGSILREAGAIVLFDQNGDEFYRDTPANDINSVNPGTAAVTRGLSLPAGVIMQARLAVFLVTHAASETYAYISNLANADSAPSQGGTLSLGGPAGQSVGGQVSAWTNTSSQVRSRLNASDGGTTLNITTLGWTDLRGKAA